MTSAGADEELVRAAQGGSALAFSRLVDRHQQALRGFLRRACGDWALAEDLAQDTFLTAWERLDRFESGGNLRAWLCGIGYNKCLSALRSNRRARAREADWQVADQRPDGMGAAERLALERAMAELPLEQRAVVSLCLAAEFSHADAAQALSLPLGTVKSHVTRGRARLMQALGAGDE